MSPEVLNLVLAFARSYTDAWPKLAGYVAAIAAEDSPDARDILRFMCELKPSTRMVLAVAGFELLDD